MLCFELLISLLLIFLLFDVYSLVEAVAIVVVVAADKRISSIIVFILQYNFVLTTVIIEYNNLSFVIGAA